MNHLYSVLPMAERSGKADPALRRPIPIRLRTRVFLRNQEYVERALKDRDAIVSGSHPSFSHRSIQNSVG